MFTQNIVSEFLPHWNARVHTTSDFFNLCDRHEIIYAETDLIACAGEYRVYRGFSFILINPYAEASYQQWVRFHELAHFCLRHRIGHFNPRTTRKLDWEANIISSVALVPRILLDRYKFSEIREFYDYPEELLYVRLEVLKRLGI